MLKKLKERLPELSEPNIPNSVVPIFRQLVTYIDGGLAESYQKEGDERAAQLVTHMLNLRDFMTRQVTENGLRQAIINEINSIISTIEEEAVEDNSSLDEHDSTKKNDPDTFLTETR